jgi:nitrogen fixation protein NifQ
MNQNLALQYQPVTITVSRLSAIDIFAQVMVYATGLPNDDLFAKILASQTVGLGILPTYLGLRKSVFMTLFKRHFPGAKLPKVSPRLVRTLDKMRLAEREDLKVLLLEHRADKDFSEVGLAEIVAAACMGGNHLWQDLGLWSRADVTQLMSQNFPALAAKNVHDMKWKKFLYKQLCQQAGVYICRAPSCEVCVDYAHCFGVEE